MRVVSESGWRARRDARRLDKDLGPEVEFSPEEAIEGAIAYMLSRGYVLDHRSGNTASFSRYSPPSLALGLVLMLLLIVPGVLYLIWGGNTLRSSLYVTPTERGCRLKVGGDPYSTAYGGRPTCKSGSRPCPRRSSKSRETAYRLN